MATDFKAICKNKTGVGHVTYPYAVKIQNSSNEYVISYYDAADHSGSLRTANRSKLVFDVYAIPNK